MNESSPGLGASRAALPGQKKAIFLVISLSLVLKVTISFLNPVINPDGVLYITAAQHYADGKFREGLSLHSMPLYPLSIVILHYFVPDWATAARLVSIICSVLSLVPLFLLTKDLFSRETAFWASLSFTLSPLPNEFAVSVIREPGFLFFLAWGVYFARRAAASARPVWFLLSSLSCLFALGFRLEGAVLFPCLTLYFIGISIRKPEKRAVLVRGTLVWLGVSLLLPLAILVATGSLGSSFNRADQLVQEVRDLVHLRFLDKYLFIYRQLEGLEDTLPYIRWGLSFSEIARHYLQTIYLIGLLDTLGRVLFPPFALALILGLQRSTIRDRLLLLFLAGCYFLVAYYFLIKNDYLLLRTPYVTAFLLQPWVGAGIQRLLIGVGKSRRARLLSVGLLIFIIVVPIAKAVDRAWRADNLVKTVGEWIRERPALQQARMVATDPRIPFYAGKGADYVRHHRTWSKDYRSLEEVAGQEKADLVVLCLPAKEKSLVPHFTRYKKLAEFSGRKNIALIYSSPDFRDLVEGKEGD